MQSRAALPFYSLVSLRLVDAGGILAVMPRLRRTRSGIDPRQVMSRMAPIERRFDKTPAAAVRLSRGLAQSLFDASGTRVAVEPAD